MGPVGQPDFRRVGPVSQPDLDVEVWVRDEWLRRNFIVLVLAWKQQQMGVR